MSTFPSPWPHVRLTFASSSPAKRDKIDLKPPQDASKPPKTNPKAPKAIPKVPKTNPKAHNAENAYNTGGRRCGAPIVN